jgi:hypothetical protein
MDDSSTHRLELLDSDEHQALQTWPLDPARELTLGRARTNDVVMASPLVSRQHARMRYTDGAWVIEAQSELGVWWRGGQRSRVALEPGISFALGEHGPKLRLIKLATVDDFDAGSTIRFRPESLGILTLDTARRDKEVAEIAESDFFRHLERKAGTLRDQGREVRAKPRSEGPRGGNPPESGPTSQSDGGSDGKSRPGGE